MNEYSRRYLKALIRIDESPNLAVTGRRQQAIDFVGLWECELVDASFVEQEDAVLSNLPRRGEFEYETPYEKPKQEVGLS